MELTLTRPDDWHLHLRDGAALPTTVPDTARTFRRAIVMPNLKPPVTTVGREASTSPMSLPSDRPSHAPAAAAMDAG